MKPSELDIAKIIANAESKLKERFYELDLIAAANHRRVLTAMRENRLSEEYFAEKTGYGMDDAGREAIDNIFAAVFQAEAAAVRMQFVSGTHAIAAALFGNLKYGDRMVALTGKPYDTMLKVIGLPNAEPGTIRAHGIDYQQVEIDPAKMSEDELIRQISLHVWAPCAVAYIQKSRGYSFERRTLSNVEIGKMARAVKAVNPDCLVIVDNCYGEFVESVESTALGVDLIAGSMIKNPGGGLAISGGYVAGKKKLRRRCSQSLDCSRYWWSSWPPI